MRPRSWKLARRSGLLAGTLLLVSALVTAPPAFATKPQPARQAPAVAALAAGGVTPAAAAVVDPTPRELPQLRTERSRTYLNEFGERETRVWAGPVNYKDAQGAWQAIDNTLVASDRAGFAWTNKAGGYRVDLPAQLGAAPIRVERGGAWVAFTPTASSAAGRVDGDTVTYDLPGGVQVAYRAANDGLKESITLPGPAAPNVFAFDLEASAGLTPRLARDGAVEFTDAKGKVPVAFAAPFLQDASKRVERHSDKAAFALVDPPPGARAARRLTLTADAGWLATPGLAWPVVIDPDVTFDRTWADTHIVSGAFADNHYGTSPELEVGLTGAGSTLRRALMRFDLGSAIPQDASVLRAELNLYHSAHLAGTGTVTDDLFQLTHDWSAATWNKYDGVNNWPTPGGDYVNSVIARASVTALGWVKFETGQLVQRWVSGEAPNYGFMMKGYTSGTNDSVERYYSNQAASTFWPNLVVTWDPRLGKRGAYTYDTKNLSDRSELDVNLANGNLLVGATDLAIRGTGLDLAVNRAYNGLADPTRTGQVGRGWTLDAGFDVRLGIYTTGSLTLAGPSGYRVPFTRTPGSTSTFISPPGINATLTYTAGASRPYVLRFNRSGEEYRFRLDGQTGVLEERVDRNGNDIDYVYDASNRLTQVIDTQNRSLTITYTGNYVDTITDQAGRVVNYDYTGDNLTKVTDPDNKFVSYSYTGDTLTRITDARGKVIDIGYATDGSRRVASVTRVTASTSDTDPKTSYAYTAFSAQTCFAGGPSKQLTNTTVTDANSHDTVYRADTRDRTCRRTDALGHVRLGEANDNDDTTSTTDALANVTSFGYSGDGRNNLTSITRPNAAGGGPAATTTFTYGAANNQFSPDTKTNSTGSKTTYGYDTRGNLLSAQDTTSGPTGGAKSSRTLNANGTIDTATDGNNHTTSYGYDTAGNLTTITPPSGSPLGVTTITPDTQTSRVQSVRDGRGNTTSYTYDKIDRVKTETVGSISVSRIFDANGNLTSLTDPTGATSFTYDELNRTLTKSAPGRPTITFAYDGVGNLKSLTDAGGTVSYDYDAADRLIRVTEPGTKITTFDNDNRDRRSGIHFPNGVDVTLDYDKAGRQTVVKAQKGTNPAIVDLKYCYRVPASSTTPCDPTSTAGADTDVRQKLTDSVAGTTVRFTYDTLDRLARAQTTAGGSDDFQYLYDKAGNRTKQTATLGGSTTTTYFGYGTANQLCWSKVTTTDPGSACTAPSGATTYTHDGNGNLTASSAGFSATYNALDQASSITGAGGSTLSPITYGGDDQTERRQAGSTNFTTSALGVGVANSTYFTRDDNGNLLAQRTATGTQYYVLDALGSVVALTDGSTGSVVGRYSYEPYGKPTFTGTVTSPFQFASGYYDTQTKLVKFGARYYDPALGRWTQRDPVEGNLGNQRTLNRYTYAGCDPVNNIDSTGRDFTLCSFEFFQTGVIFGVALALAPISLGESIVIGIIIETILFIGESVSCP